VLLPIKYLVKTALYGAVPGGFSYQRQLRALANPNYNIEQDKHPVRLKHNGQTGWKNDSSSIKHRAYSSYDEYKLHQKQKYEEILQLQGGFNNRTVVIWRHRFYKRFHHLDNLLNYDAVILCLGARQGTEVEVLRDLGFSNAYGIDLNPGPNNPYVQPGDFMHLDEENESVDMIYTNSIDHAFELSPFLAENLRVLKSGGLALYDLPRYSGSRNPGAFEAVGWSSEGQIMQLIRQRFERQLLSQVEPKWQWALWQKK
jgi:SAM-dependent methyltransferase